MNKAGIIPVKSIHPSMIKHGSSIDEHGACIDRAWQQNPGHSTMPKVIWTTEFSHFNPALAGEKSLEAYPIEMSLLTVKIFRHLFIVLTREIFSTYMYLTFPIF